MGEFFGSVWWLLVTLGLLITFHEFGHFWVARRLGVRVLRFSVGFGSPIWRRVGSDGTEYVIAAIPLGGYVRMLDEREGEVPAEQVQFCFNRKPIWSRIAIVAAGPLANILFAIGAFWLMFVVGKPDYQPIVGQPAGIAATAGLRAGDRMLELGGQPLRSWSGATLALIEATLERADVTLLVAAEGGSPRSLNLPLSRIDRDLDERAAMRALGIQANFPPLPAVIGSLAADRPAARSGLAIGDRIIAVNDHPVQSFDELYETVQAQAVLSPAISLKVRRSDALLNIETRAEPGTDRDGKANFQIGIGPAPVSMPPDMLLQLGPLEAIPAAVAETWRMTATTFSFLRHMLVGNASLRNVSGPIGIARVANISADQGVAWFLSFLALMSLSIGILNLLPIPILDGGHLMYYLIELVKGSPVSERTLVAGQYLGLALLAGLMSLAFYNDIAGLIR